MTASLGGNSLSHFTKISLIAYYIIDVKIIPRKDLNDMSVNLSGRQKQVIPIMVKIKDLLQSELNCSVINKVRRSIYIDPRYGVSCYVCNSEVADLPFQASRDWAQHEILLAGTGIGVGVVFCTLRALIKGELESKSEMRAGVGPGGSKGSSKISSPRVKDEKQQAD